MFILMGRYLEAISKQKAADAVNLLGGLRPSTAILDSSGEQIDVEFLDIGDVVRIPKGSSPPHDGDIIAGSTEFDQSALSGESKPQRKSVGDKVYSGTINLESAITSRITAIGGSGVMDQIVQAVRQGNTNRAPIEALADTLTSYFVPLICALSLLTWIIWMSLGLSGALPESYLDTDVGGWVVWSLEFAIATLVIACPCGLGLAAPTACFVGSALAAKYGILVRGGGEAFQAASSIDCVVFDKTGTLTRGGEPDITASEIFLLPECIHDIAAEVESYSNHSLAKAMTQYCRSKSNSIPLSCSNFKEQSGLGISADVKVGNELFEVLIGSEAYMEQSEAKYIPGTGSSNLETWKAMGKSVVLVAIKPTSVQNASSKIAAQFAISDTLKDEAAYVVDKLTKAHIQVWMISGDNESTARAIAAKVGIPNSRVIAGVLPQEKAEKVVWLQKTLAKGGKQNEKIPSKGGRAIVAMVGDGINDAPALSTADISIAMGNGTDFAVGVAKFVLLQSNLKTILTLIDLSKVVYRRVKLNLAW